MSGEDRRGRDRFCQIFALVHADQSETQLAMTYDKSVGTIRNWRSESAAPPKQVRSKILAEWGLRLDLENVPDEEWEQFCDDVDRSKLINRKKVGIPPWYYEGGEIEIIERGISDEIRHVYVITDDAYNDSYVTSIVEAVKANIGRGVNYTYVTNSKCPNIDALVDNIEYMVSEFKCGQRGKVELVVVKVSDNLGEWLLIDHVMLMMSDVYLYQDIQESQLTFTKIIAAYEQIYKLNDQVKYGTGWIRMSVRKQRAILALLRNWNLHSEVRTW